MDQQFSLTWKNFHGNLSDGFSDLLGNGDFVDVTLACDGQFLQAHRAVLSICSPYFKRMFQLNPCQHPIVVLRDISHHAMKDLIHFMYNGEVNVRQEDLAGFINTAETLQIKGLTNKHTENGNSEEALAKLPSPPMTVINSKITEPTTDTTNPFSDDLTHHLENSHNQIELLNSLRLAALKRKSEEFLANNFNTPFNEKNQPEKKIKLREKHILNRHKVGTNFTRSTSMDGVYETNKPRNEINSSPVNSHNDTNLNNHSGKLPERSNSVNDAKTVQEVNGRNNVDVKQEKVEEFDISCEESSLHRPLSAADNEKSLDMTSPRMDQEDGAHNETPPTILRASWPISQQNRKSTSSPGNSTPNNLPNGHALSVKSSPTKNTLSVLPTPVQIISNIQSSVASLPLLNSGQSHHTIITIPQKEDGKKKYPQRSCRFCWRKAGPLSFITTEPRNGALPLRYRYIFSRKGHKQLVFMNFVYTKHSTTHGKTSWRCVQYFSLNRCPATVETVGAMIYTINHVHNHEDCSDKICKNSVYEMNTDKEV